MKAVHSLVLLAACLPGAACAADASKGEDVRFKTADGLTIAATFYPAAEGTPLPVPVVIALPMYRHTRDTYAPVVGPLTARGMAVLALDLRGHGDSAKQGDENLSQKVESRDPSIFTAMHQDVEGAIAWLAREKHTPKRCIGLLGASVGCSVAIDTAVRDPGDVACVVCLTPGKDYLGVPTMDHIAHWTTGMPLLLVSSDAEAANGASPIASKLDGAGAELKLVAADDPSAAKSPMDLHGTNMFGRVSLVEENVADWIAYRLVFRRVDLGGGVAAVVGSMIDVLYVGVELAADSKVSLDGLVVRVGLGPVTDRWSKSSIVDAGKRFGAASKEFPLRRRTKLGRERLGVEAGVPFAVSVSLDGKKFLPQSGEPALLFCLR